MTTSSARLALAMQACPLVAILRGIRPEEAAGIGQALYHAGFRLIEVPLNSPQPFDSIAAMRAVLPEDCLLGAGTVIDPDDVTRVRDAGGAIIVMPHSDPAVIRRAKAEGMLSLPGVATPTEAFAALAAGADALKLFPAEQVGPSVLRAWRAVLRAPLLPVGGITPHNLAEFAAAGASGFGLGSALYKPGLSADEVGARAREFVAAWQAIAPR
ncbi:2-dehydro-3-deoxy-6-phosphogalactonate aldolase [Bordetella genomosp. 1]|uniref:2-dehydro-3-deoxy-6-phosphogalactonate aldolase n=1 Tax=Bordetella genomosp. 1 TaxID=1395607 RepID=A0A261RV13_9BORD|nr:2-dehydro-3-deoxy-6-phosphogalactonate aldolase [Bordetella genomosp. 1]OZI28894.1 2-dehydro-3-deoxy-6-phosphogalactonate aldolase [Bordetella genomosp. 1]